MKTAIIRAYLENCDTNREAQARGQGRSERRAASRALLNLLRDKRLRRQKAIRIHLDLVITNTPRNDSKRTGASTRERNYS